ncbi:BQ2448_6732 [Microbotryum intermedium]|uniref:Mitochondrial DNA polymerase catalytic subunit n=1 Tax=Microbotryum intermedium TaxID=269621 RepID=A0A238FKH6_9BASI|nr:BQ2448_6732 [Microbotryum intermedium]
MASILARPRKRMRIRHASLATSWSILPSPLWGSGIHSTTTRSVSSRTSSSVTPSHGSEAQDTQRSGKIPNTSIRSSWTASEPPWTSRSLQSARAKAILTSFHPSPLNEAQVPLISPHLRAQLFPPPGSPFTSPPPSPNAIKTSLDHLVENGLLKENLTSTSKRSLDPAISFSLPATQGPTMSHHFHALGKGTAEPYLSLACSFAEAELPPMPEKGSWACVPGWARYSAEDRCWESVEYPDLDDQALVFDVETLPHQSGAYPIMAVAVGKSAWYGWCSPWVTRDDPSPRQLIPFGPREEEQAASTADGDFLSSRSDLFERPTSKPRLIVGHNVLFDRARVSTEYESLRRPSTRYIDTLSLHVAVSGLTNPQRPQWMAWRSNEKKKDAAALLAAAAEAEVRLEPSPVEDEEEETGTLLVTPPRPGTSAAAAANATKASKKGSGPPSRKTWEQVASMNSLAEVARLHCGITMDKTIRNILIDPETTLDDVRSSFDDLIDYCARDVVTTAKVYQVLLPKFLATCPHPVSFAGVLLMSQPVLPVDSRWPQYIERAESTYVERLTRVKDALKALAEEARAKMDVVDPGTGEFVWQRDVWLRQLDWSLKKARRLPGQTPSKVASGRKQATVVGEEVEKQEGKQQVELDPMKSRPRWFDDVAGNEPLDIGLQSPLAAALLRTKWRGHPVVYSHSHGFLFAVPKDATFEADSTETPIDATELGPKDASIAKIKNIRLNAIPGSGGRRCLTLFSKNAITRVKKKLLECDLGSDLLLEALRSTSGTPKDISAILDEAARVALNKSDEERSQSIWLRQLDWTPVPLRKQADPVPETTRTKSTLIGDADSSSLMNGSLLQTLAWPKWYWELDLPGLGLDVSVRKRAVPLLLRLKWRGFPIVHSKQHGWIYRVPLGEVDALMTSDRSLKPLDFTSLDDTTLAEDADAIYFKLPHPDGEDKNVGSPLSKLFVQAFEDKVLTSDYEIAQDALSLNASCSYWASARERITNQFVVWGGKAKVETPTPARVVEDPSLQSTQGLILPQVIPMGTVTRRAVERTWLTASNAKKNRVGSELKSMVRAPPGYAIVGADVDSEELWICSVMGDAQFGLHGATAIGWMTLEGTKSAGTDLHSKTASILSISRDDAKVFNYSRIYGAGVKHAVQLLLKANPTLAADKATELAKNLYAQTKGVVDRSPAFRRNFWHGGTESFVFNKLEGIAQSDRPRTPALGCGLTDALTKAYLPPEAGRATKGSGFMPSRINWVVQSSGVDYLHLLLVAMEYLTRRYEIDARYMISVHDEIRYLVKEEDRYRAALALQVANLWTRSLFAYRLQMPDLPQVSAWHVFKLLKRKIRADAALGGHDVQGCAFFSAVDVDTCFRKEVNMTCVTPSNPDAIPFGESLDISTSLSTTNGGSLYADGRPMTKEEEARLPEWGLEKELQEDEWKGEVHRVDQIGFLVAQTTKDRNRITQLWKETVAGQHPSSSTMGKRPTNSTVDREAWMRDVHDQAMEEAMGSNKSVGRESAVEENEEGYYDEIPEDVEREFSTYRPATRTSV